MNNVRRAVLTGGNGYIGSVLLQQLLAAGVEVHAIAHQSRERLDASLPATQIHSSDGRDAFFSELVVRLQPDAIFHLATIQAEPHGMDAMTTMMESNIHLGTALLHGASLCERKPVFVNTGTYWQFADGQGYAPKTFYAATKQAFQDLMVYFCKCQGLSALTLVLYDSFGPDDTRPKLWTKLLHAPAGSTLPLTEGRQEMELLHVRDIARAFVHAANLLHAGEGLHQTYAVRSDVRCTLREMLEAWHRNAQLDIHFEWGAVPYTSGQVFSPWRGQVLPGWHPSVDVHTEIAEWLRTKRHESKGVSA